MPEPAKALIRPVAPGDVPQINTLLRRVWFPERSERGFDWLFTRNPGQSRLPAGWVLEGPDGRVSAFLGNYVQRAWRSGESFPLAAGHSFVADPQHGGRALGLLRTFLRQGEPILLSGMNSNPVSARIYKAMQLSAYPETAALKLGWTTNPVVAALGALSWRAHGLARQALVRHIRDIRRAPPDVAGILSRSNACVAHLPDPETHPGLAQFDMQLRAGRRLFTERSPAALAWRLGDPDASVPPVLIAYPETGAVRGLALLQFNKPSEAEPPYLDVIDLVSLDPGDSVAIQALMHAALALARQSGAAKLRLSMVTPELLELLGPLVEKARKITGPAPHAFYKASPDMPHPIEHVWQPLPYDGDNGPSLRALPIRTP